MKKENYTVTGMSCAACALAVEKAVNKKEVLMRVNMILIRLERLLKKVDMDYWKRCLRMKRFRCIKIR